MIFRYTKGDLKDLKTAEKYRFILGNGLGGFIAGTAAFSVSRCDDGILCGSFQVPNVRKLLVHRLKETLRKGNQSTVLSMQRFADGTEEGSGLKFLTGFEMDALPVWNYQIGEVSVSRTLTILHGENTSVIRYEIENRSSEEAEWIVDPGFLMCDKGEAVSAAGRSFGLTLCEETRHEAVFTMDGFDPAVRILTDGTIAAIRPREDVLSYPDDAKDGRPGQGAEAHAAAVSWRIAPGEKKTACILFSAETKQTPEQNPVAEPVCDPKAVRDIPGLLETERQRLKELLCRSRYSNEAARELSRAADLYLSAKEATNGSTLIAGYPFFRDWGRDTMISIPGCILAVGKYEEAREIFRTFLKYERNGLVPNLFPEKGKEPMYNSVDAPLLLIEGLKLYIDRCGDWDFIRENYGVLQKIIRAYMTGTDYGIHMDTDTLIAAGNYPWQLTWMDVCIDGILPTPRYGKPVEIGAYWYNALMIMAEFAAQLGDPEGQNLYAGLAGKVKTSFVREFWMPDAGYLKDVVSGEAADLQIRCNQIWALSLSYNMLTHEQEREILKTVKKHLYTPYGLRTLSPDDPEYKGFYGGTQFERDMAYHQGTIWVYPLGAYYRALLKAYEYSAESVAVVTEGLKMIPQMMREGCIGQLPEIYDGDTPGESKGCYAQCWSVGEILRVYEELNNRV